ncbi:MAG: zinc ribbon domain-containing protein [Candidatus Heimdallarchaeota archaeon]|nr:zinc ribbon domain-containing protein [Candidatus Heimdallarchaeota archaeon]MCK4612973.1 zinc ribbon domain-containing protein [Candidatus Heimdallarchaeota archaeon]
MNRKIRLLLISFTFIILLSSVVSAKNLLREEVSVSALSFRSYYLNMDSDYTTIKLSVDVYFGDITVGVLDEANYAIWVDGYDAQAYFVRNDLIKGDFDVELGPAGIYYIVLDNSDSLFSTQVKLVVSVSTVGETVGIVIGAIIGFSILVLIVIRSTKSRGIQQPHHPQQLQMPIIKTPESTIYPTQPTQKTVKYCKECGSRLDIDSNFCPNCGLEQ